MVWVRLADDFTDHPKVIAAGPIAGWLFVCGLAYANRYLTDGFIPAAQVRRLADIEDAYQEAGRLVDAGLWEPSEGGFVIHDYHAYQPSADDVKREREAAAQRQADYRKRRSSARQIARNAVTNGVTNAVTHPPRNAAPDPARPGPALDTVLKHPEKDVVVGVGANAPPEPAKKGRQRAKPTRVATEAPDDFEIGERLRDFGEGLGLNQARLADETDHFLDHHRAKGTKFTDWSAAWREWMRRAIRYDPPPATNGHAAIEGHGLNGTLSKLTPPTDDDRAIWSRALDELRGTMNPVNFEAYLEPLEVAGRGPDGGLRLLANPVIADHLGRMKTHIVRALTDAGDPKPAAVGLRPCKPKGQTDAE